MKVIESCGCVFCDLGIKPVFKDGPQLVHLVQIGRRVVVVDCTKREPEVKKEPG